MRILYIGVARGGCHGRRTWEPWSEVLAEAVAVIGPMAAVVTVSTVALGLVAVLFHPDYDWQLYHYLLRLLLRLAVRVTRLELNVLQRLPGTCVEQRSHFCFCSQAFLFRMAERRNDLHNI